MKRLLILSLASSKHYQWAFNQRQGGSYFLHELIRDSRVLDIICSVFQLSDTAAVNECASGDKGGPEKHSSAICKDVYLTKALKQLLITYYYEKSTFLVLKK